MQITISGLILGLILGLLCLILFEIWHARRNIERSKQQFKRMVSDFISPGDDGGPSDLAQTVDPILQLAGIRIAAAVKGTLMGVESGLARGERQVKAAILKDSAPPWMKAVMNSYPRLEKLIDKNPDFAGLAMSHLGDLAKKVPAEEIPVDRQEPLPLDLNNQEVL